MCACYSKDVQKMEFILLKDYELRGKILSALSHLKGLCLWLYNGYCSIFLNSY